MKICVVSPHRGDAGFALGLSLVRWANAGHRISLVNCFTRSAHAPYSDADTVHVNDRMSYVSALRQKEDRLFLRRLAGAELIDLRLKDAPIRLKCAEQEACGFAVHEADRAIPKIANALEKRLGQNQVDVLLLPLGVGSHIDHTTTTEAALPFARTLPCAFYEDMPYGSREDADYARENLSKAIASQIESPLSPAICRASAAESLSKRGIAEIYCSQVDESSVASMTTAAERNGGERVWVNERLLKDASMLSALMEETPHS